MKPSLPNTSCDYAELPAESELAVRPRTSLASIRWMRSGGRLGYMKPAGNRTVRCRCSQEIADLSALQVCASVHADPRAAQLVDIAAFGDEDASECAAADLSREFPDIKD